MLTRVGVPVEFEAEYAAPDSEPTTLICFSHLRWNFVFQRPQHLMSRFAREMNVIYWEEPAEIGEKETAFLQVREAEDAANVHIVVPHLPQGMPEDAREATLKRLRRRGDSIALEVANPSYETRIFGPDRVRVQGRLVGLIRRY